MQRRWLRVLLWVAVALIGLPLLLSGLVYVAANSDAGRVWIERVTARLTHGGVQLTGLGGHFPSQLRLERLELRDPHGLWLAIDDIELRWSPLRLTAWQAQAALLQAARVDMERAPAYPRKPQTPPTRLHWPAVRIERLAVDRFELGAPLTGSPVALQVEGSGSWASLEQAALQLDARRLDAVPSSYRVSAQFDAAQVQAQLDLSENAEGPLAHLVQLPDIGAVSVHLRLSGPREAVVATLALQAGGLTGNASGAVNLRTGASALKLTLAAGAMAPRPDLSWQKLKLDGEWRGPLSAPETTAQLQAEQVAAPGVKFSVLGAQLQGHSGTLVLDASSTGLVLPGRLGTLFEGAPLTAHALMHLDQTGRPIEFALSHPLLGAVGRWSGGSSNGSGSLTANVSDLKPLAALYSVDLEGRGSVDVEVHAVDGVWQAALGSVLEVSGGRSPLVALLRPKSSVSAQLRFDQRGLVLDRAQLSAARAQGLVHGSYAHGALDLAWTLTLPDVAALVPRMTGALNAQGQLQGEAPRLALSADVAGQVALNGAPSGEVRLKLRARDVPQRPLGQLEFSATLDAAPLELDATVQALPDGTLDAKIERGSWKSLSAGGEVHVAAGSNAPRGRMQLTVQRLEDLGILIGQPLQGSLDARLEFDGAAPGGKASVQVSARDAGLPSQQLETLQLSGEIDTLMTQPTLALQLAAQTRIADVPASLTAQLHGPLEAVAMKLSAASQGDANTRAQLNADARLDCVQRELRVSALQLEYHGQKAHLLQPATLSFADGLAIDRLRLGVGDSVWQVQGRFTPAMDLSASLHDLSPDLMRPWLPQLQADGRINADISLQGSLAAPVGSVQIEAHGLHARAGAARALPAADFSLKAQLQAPVAQLEMQLNAGQRLQLHATGQAPLSRTAPISLKIGGSFDLLLVDPILEASGQRLQGEAKLDADIAGTLAAPQARGTLQLTHADLQDYPRGLRLTEIAATLTADGDHLELQQLEAHAGTGTLRVSGTLGLGGDMPLLLKLEGHNARPVSSDLITANVDMNFTLAGPLRGPLGAAGSLHVIRAEFNIPNALPSSVAVLDVRRPGQTVVPERSSTFNVNLDLAVDAPRAIFVRGHGLDAELGGSLHVGGTSNDPDISGGFDLRSGTINLAGSTLTFTSGRLSFNGSGVKKKIDPTLDFTATNIVSNVTSTLNVGGYADAPVITLSSTPEQPQDQILARLLFGADPAQLSTLQIAQIAAALATMSGIGGGAFNPLNAVQRKLHLDRLAVSGNTSNAATASGGPAQGTSTGATIEAGRYVSSRVYVGAKQFTSGTTQAQVQVDLIKNLKVQTTIGTGGGTVQGETPQNDPGSSIGLSYQFEY
ncbi:MAG TPA: translocation/assembly module TamB domain-containing protein [Steroidobacteraceae bacterium]|nr:translocation/assembly module TamB domain-containing protein [Steroidobacteraceae bacterium]